MKRRDFLKNTGLLMAAAPFMNFAKSKPLTKKMIVLGFDGMDPQRVMNLIQRGELPNLKKLAQMGTFTMMRSTIPPQSPVAWGSFITGSDPGTYGIYDFVHRNPENYMPIFSQSETLAPEWVVSIGKYKIPLKPGKVILKREGKAFWDYLEERDINATIFKVPTNYPPSKSNQRTISGMGTPDITGGYGMYSLYTTDEDEYQKDITPNRVYYAYIDDDNVLEGEIEGPRNDLVKDRETVKVPFKTYVDYKHKTLRIDVQGKKIILREKQYSDWVEIDFPLIKGVSSITGMVKFFALNIRKNLFRLYVSPIHISPLHPALPISTPDSYSKELAEKNGLFHTISLPADTKALSQLTFGVDDFITQSMSVFDESSKIFDYEFERFLGNKQDFLFFYFSALDQGQHMFWALNDKTHPYYHEKEGKEFGYITDELYRKHDEILGRVLKKIPKNIPIVVLSDHGFGPFKRKVNLNKFLYDEGYLKLSTKDISEDVSILEYADWGNSKAYAVGLNGLYLNMKGREGEGIVTQSERRRILEEIKGKLEALRDPDTGEVVVTNAYISEDNFSKDYIGRAPDIIVGYKRGFRTGDSSAIGSLAESVVRDNMNWWSGDHCIDPLQVPASFLSNFKINKKVPNMMDIAPTILKFFGINNPSTMKGKSLV